MLGTIKDWVVGICAFLLVLVFFLIFFGRAMETPDLTKETYEMGVSNFNTCATDIDDKKELAMKIESNEFIYMSDSDLEKAYPNYSFETECDTSFVQSSSDQISTMAMEAYNYAEEYFGTTAVGVVDAVYSAPSSYYAYLGVPQEYLFFAMTDDQQKIAAIIVQPNVDGTYEVSSVWDSSIAGDLEQTQLLSNHLLLKYNQKIK